ncbi:hypothetical protein BT93_I0259 [Corymbia citriodora subsp. variegata]|nr:hypothetical protein BT93_I0259 [Corymbia citriodora subsp. variegata]
MATIRNLSSLAMDIKKIENATKRQVTFSKRRSSLIKKIHETAICCDIDAAFVAFSPSGRLSKFCSRNRSNSNIDHLEVHLARLIHMELQVKKSKIELEISEAELRNYLPDPTQDPSLAELEWCEDHLKTSLEQMIQRKTSLKCRQPQPEDGAPQDLQGPVNASTSFVNESIVNKPGDLSFFSFPSVQESSVGALIPQGHEHGPNSDYIIHVPDHSVSPPNPFFLPG